MDLTLIGQHCAHCGAAISLGDSTCPHCQQPVDDPAVSALASSELASKEGASLTEVGRFISLYGCATIASASLMLHYLESGDTAIATMATRCLQTTADPAVLRELVSLLGTRTWLGHPTSLQFSEVAHGPLSIMAVIRNVFQVGGPIRSAVLVDCLKSTDQRVREAAAELLQYSRGKEVADSLAEALSTDSDPTVRARAAFALGQVCDPTSVGVLTRALNDSSAQVQNKAAQSLSRLGVRAIPSAVESLENGAPEVAMQGARLLGQLGSPEAIRTLVDALKHRRDLVRLYAEQALVNMGTDVIKPLLEEVIRNGDSVGVREGVAYVLRMMRMPDREHSILSPVVKAAERLDAGIEMPAAAYEALGALEGLTPEQLRVKLARIGRNV